MRLVWLLLPAAAVTKLDGQDEQLVDGEGETEVLQQPLPPVGEINHN
jgi:hypothetical protein